MRVVSSQLHLRHVRFAGPSGVGKSTAVRSVSSVVTHRPAPIIQLGDPPQQSVDATDVGEWCTPSGAVVSLIAASGFAVPDLERLGALPRAGATVLWLFGDRRDGFGHARHWLERLIVLPEVRRLTVAITRLDQASVTCPSLSDYEALVSCFGSNVPVLAADPRSPRDVHDVLHVAMRGSFVAGLSA
jgi:energy-coupling factor transporter ATP-binding protein EcfA2